MGATQTGKTPNDILANRIVTQLVASDLIEAADRGKVEALLMSGKAREEDWQLWAEKKADAVPDAEKDANAD